MIKKRNLDPSLVQWIMSQTGLGPGIGELFWVAPAKSSTSQYRTQLQRWGVEQNYKIYSDITVAEAAMESYRNDVMLVMPGAYNTKGALTWSKHNSCLLGLGHPIKNWYGDGGAVTIRNVAETDGAYGMLNTGNYCNFINAHFDNLGEDAACVCSVKEQGRDPHYRGCLFGGHVRSEQAGAAAAAAIWVDTSVTAAGHGLVLDDCVVGYSGSYTRSNSNTLLLFGATGASGSGSNVTLRNTVFNSRSKVAGCSAIKFAANNTVDRMFLIDGCTFYNFYDANDITSTLTEVINDDCATTHKILVRNSFQTGWASWEGTRSTVYLTQADASGASGIAAVET